MRTTLTLDPDVASRLSQSAKATQLPFKQIVNQALRAGLDALEAGSTTGATPFATPTASLGTPLVGDLANVHEALSIAEGDRRR
jgi:hypothetical protein